MSAEDGLSAARREQQLFGLPFLDFLEQPMRPRDASDGTHHILDSEPERQHLEDYRK